MPSLVPAILAAALLGLASTPLPAQQWTDPPPNLVQATPVIYTSGQPPARSLRGLKEQGFEAVVYLAPPTVPNAVHDEWKIVGNEKPDEAWKAVEKIWTPRGPWKRLIEEQLGKHGIAFEIL